MDGLVNDAVKQFERAQDFLGTIPRAAEKALSRALNRAVMLGRDTAIAAIDQRYAVNPSDVREKITLTTATPDKLVVSIVARSGSLSLGYFPHSPIAAGTGGPGKPVLRAEVLRGKPKDVPGAFIAPINGKPRVMIRVGGKTATGNAAIRSVSTVPIASMLGADSVEEAVHARMFAVLDEQLGREIDRELGKAA